MKQTLITEARADERKAMLDMPKLKDEKQDKVFSTFKGGISNMGSNHYRNQLRAEIRTAIKKMEVSR